MAGGNPGGILGEIHHQLGSVCKEVDILFSQNIKLGGNAEETFVPLLG